MNKPITALALVDTASRSIIPTESDVRDVLEELSDMERIPFGRIKIAPAAAGIYNIVEAGSQIEEPVKEFEGIVLMRHYCNAYWPGAFGSSPDKNPVCSSLDGKEGITQDGEVRKCTGCPYNDYVDGPDGKKKPKPCKNMERLYILLEGCTLPFVLSLPPTAMKTFDGYRTLLSGRHGKLRGVMTKFTLTKSKSNEGTPYSVPQFETVGVLSVEDAAKVKEYAEAMLKAAERAGITAEDYEVPEADGRVQTGAQAASRVQNAKDAAINVDPQSGFVQVDEDVLPDNF
jgi:hypothetical protein